MAAAMETSEETPGLVHEDSPMLNPPARLEQSDDDDAEELDAENAAQPMADEENGDVRASQVTLEQLEKQEPRDRFRLVYIIMVVHGIAVLMPWNVFITAKSYFENYKLGDDNNLTNSEVRTYRRNFMAYIGMAAQSANVLTNLLNLFCQWGGKPAVRTVGSMVIIIFIFLLTIVLAMVDSSEWPASFFWITIFSAVIANGAGGIYQNNIYGEVAALPMKYTNAIIFGNNFSGTFVAIVNILVIAMAPDSRSSALYYFVFALVVILVALDSYFLLPHTNFFQHYKRLQKLRLQQNQRSRPETQTCATRLLTYWHVFKQIWVLAVSVWFVFFVSLALFPQIQSDIKRLSIRVDDEYWTPVFCYLSFNLFALLGNVGAHYVQFPGPKWVWVPVLLRVVFIPLYLMFNFRPESSSGSPPIGNDYVYIFCSILMAFSGGYFSSLCMMYAPVPVEPYNVGTAGMMMSLCLVMGILSGVSASRVLVTMV